MLTPGTTAPAFTLPDENGKTHNLSEYLGRWLLVYFYPEDDTPGCTLEACGFRDRLEEAQERNCAVLGVSADSQGSHQAFIGKYQLTFPLLSDTEKTMIKAYEAWGVRDASRNPNPDILRLSYLIDPEGIIQKSYRVTKAEDHATEVVADLEALQG